MLSKCPVCGRKYNILDLIAQPPMCIPCSQAGAKDPNCDTKVQRAESQRFVGRVMIAAAIGIVVIVLFVPSRQGASPGGTFYLLGLAAIALSGGLMKTSAAARTLRSKQPKDDGGD